jgi:poly(3-hydroxybutyrate) depolymerase
MKHVPLFALAAILLVASGSAIGQSDIVAKFVARSQPYAGGSLPYRLFIPDGYDSTQSYPLILALHGSGESGTDNLAQLTAYRMATTWADPVNQAAHPCFVAAPQSPSMDGWSPFAGVLIDLVDSLCRQYSIDTNRLIVTGLSMGGYGTWVLIDRYPGKFAAAVPMSGGLDTIHDALFHNVPIWDFHGAIDNVVPVSESRRLIDTMERLGRSVVFTNGHGSDYRGTPDSLLQQAVEAHDDLFYTEYQFGGHVIWNESYDNPYLHEWVFDHYKRAAGALHLTGLSGYPSLHDQQDITWTGGTPADTVELWWSSDGGDRWTPITINAPNTGSFSWNTLSIPDCGLGLIRAFLKNDVGFCYAEDESGFVRVDNAGDGTPTVHIIPLGPLYSAAAVTSDSIALPVIAADPEGQALTATVAFSSDTGRTFLDQGSVGLASSPLQQQVPFRLSDLPNTTHAMVRVSVSDGSLTGSDATVLFIKTSPRETGPTPTATAGGSNDVVKVDVVDPTALTGDAYRVTFADSSGTKWYDVEDVTKSITVVQRAMHFDGVTEGPQFDGIRLIVTDYPQTLLDTKGTQWTRGTSTYRFLVFLPVITFDTTTLRGFPSPSDYQITIADHVVDTSVSAILGLPVSPIQFSVWNETAQRKASVGFLDDDGNGVLSNQDEIYLLEPDSIGQSQLTWGMTYDVPPYSTAPLAGDVFTIKTLKPIKAGDTYEFSGTVLAVPVSRNPAEFALDQNYPNPFNPSTVIRGTIPADVHVRLRVYDILGRLVATLADGTLKAGGFSYTFDGRGLASGVYFCRLEAGSFVQTRKMLLLK